MATTLNSLEFCCDICFDNFGSDNKVPRMLNCGHSFCEECLLKLIKYKSFCPTCQKRIKYTSAKQVPINYSVKQMMELVCEETKKLQVSVKEGNSPKTGQNNKGSLPFEGICSNHSIPNHFKCIDCSVFLCGTCVALQHKSCKTCLISEVLQELKTSTLNMIQRAKESRERIIKTIEDDRDHLLDKKRISDKEVSRLKNAYDEELKVSQKYSDLVEKRMSQTKDSKNNLQQYHLVEDLVLEAKTFDSFNKAKALFSHHLNTSEKTNFDCFREYLHLKEILEKGVYEAQYNSSFKGMQALNIQSCTENQKTILADLLICYIFYAYEMMQDNNIDNLFVIELKAMKSLQHYINQALHHKCCQVIPKENNQLDTAIKAETKAHVENSIERTTDIVTFLYSKEYLTALNVLTIIGKLLNNCDDWSRITACLLMKTNGISIEDNIDPTDKIVFKNNLSHIYYLIELSEDSVSNAARDTFDLSCPRWAKHLEFCKSKRHFLKAKRRSNTKSPSFSSK